MAIENEIPTGLLERRREEANRLIREYALTSAGVGLIPYPIVDVVAIAAIEVDLIGKLARVYDFPVPGKLVVYKVLISLAASVAPVYVSTHLLKAATGMTFFGYGIHALLMGTSGGVSVYAVGKVFQKHYESGGTFLSADNSIVKKYFRECYAEGKKIVPGYLARA